MVRSTGEPTGAPHARASGTLSLVDPLRRDDVERARATSPEERARQAFDAMRTGVRLKRAALRARDPGASGEEIEARVRRWLERNG